MYTSWWEKEYAGPAAPTSTGTLYKAFIFVEYVCVSILFHIYNYPGIHGMLNWIYPQKYNDLDTVH